MQETSPMARKSLTTSRNRNTLARSSSSQPKAASATTHSTGKQKQRNRAPHQKVCWIPKEVRRVATILRTDTRDAKKRKVPCLVFRGDWLRDAGFAPGTPILVRVVVRGQLVVDRFV
jgi:hypothetical protein